MSTEFIVEKQKFGVNFSVDDALRQQIEAAIQNHGGAGNPQMVFALVVDHLGRVHLLCGKNVRTGTPLEPVYNVWNSNDWQGHANLRHNFPGGVNGSFLHPSENDVLIIEYPTADASDAYVGFCTYIGGRPYWF